MAPWAVACQAPLSVKFSRQEYWSELPCPSPGDLPNPGIKLGSPELQADSLLSEPPGKPEVIRTKSLIALEKAGRNQRIENAALEDDTRLECKTEAGEASYSKDRGAVLFIIMVHRQPASLPLEMFMKMQVLETRTDSLNQNCSYIFSSTFSQTALSHTEFIISFSE